MTSTSRKPRRRATSTSSYCRRVLSALHLDLGLGGLADVDHRLAPQHRRRQRVSPGHRPPPGRGAAGLDQQAGEKRDDGGALAGPIPRSFTESRDMLSWRGGLVVAGTICGVVMMLLPDNG